MKFRMFWMLSGMMCISTLIGAADDGRDSQANASAYSQVIDDYRLMTEIKAALKGGFYNKEYGNVIVAVRNGNVTLRGSVDTENEKAVVLDSLRSIAGIKNINNEITVLYSKSRRQ